MTAAGRLLAGFPAVSSAAVLELARRLADLLAASSLSILAAACILSCLVTSCRPAGVAANPAAKPAAPLAAGRGAGSDEDPAADSTAAPGSDRTAGPAGDPIAARVSAEPAAGAASDAKPDSTARFEAVGVKAKDGDSLVVRFDNGLEEEVRLLGVDAPEHGQELADETRSFLQSRVAGRRLVLETEAEQRDDYNRLLAHVLVDGRSLNLELLEKGFAAVLLIPPNTARADALLEAQARGHEQGLGLWRPGLVLEEPRSWRWRRRTQGKEAAVEPLVYEAHLITGNRKSRVAHWPACRHVREIDPRNRVLLHSVAEAERLGYRMEKRSR